MLFEIDLMCVIVIVVAIAVVSVINTVAALIMTNKMVKSIENMTNKFIDSVEDLF